MANDTGGSGDRDKGAADDDGVRTGQYLVYFSAERTLMAWVRTALAFMALGFVIDRLGLVLRTMAPQLGKVMAPSALSLLAGAGLVIVGAVMAVVAAVRYVNFARRYRRTRDTHPGHGLEPALFFTVVVAVAGAIIAAYLMTVMR
ncbi:MAG: YidH family protein [Stellaceae bacterium]